MLLFCFSVFGEILLWLAIAGNLRNRRCHPSAPTLGWLCCMATKKSSGY
ncbi:hypothetical protein GO685_05045 [Wolbachia endosymbiont of Madathamugadia hiepei]|nr:hypothetical protein [Wolbachia endosymbiont of Madathamugadia hiepei]